MKTKLREYPVSLVSDGFVYNELEGRRLLGLSGRKFDESVEWCATRGNQLSEQK
jgi:hypothetical protein